MMSKTFRDVEIWQRAHRWVLGIYRLTDGFPKQEIYGLTSQFRRAAISIPANFTEGFKKAGKADKLRFYNIAQGSLEECRYYLILAEDLGYGNTSELSDELETVSRMLEAYMRAIRNSR